MKPLYTDDMKRWLGGYVPTAFDKPDDLRKAKTITPEAAEKQRAGGRKGKLKGALSKVSA